MLTPLKKAIDELSEAVQKVGAAMYAEQTASGQGTGGSEQAGTAPTPNDPKTRQNGERARLTRNLKK